MRYSYGIVDRRKILLYNPQLFLNDDNILVFPSKDFQKWHGHIKEYIDGLYQINSKNMEKTKTISIDEHNLAIGVLNNITEELEHLFNSENMSDFSYHYISTLDDKYKKLNSVYNNDMRKCDIRIPIKPEITPWQKYQNMMKIVEEAWELFKSSHKKKYY